MLLKNKFENIETSSKNGILLDKEERYCYAQDASNSRLDTKIPDAVVFAETVDDIVNTVKYANEHNIPVIARGAGTNMVGACLCPKGGIVLNFSKMNKILDFNPIDMTVKVQAGVVVGDLRKFAEERGLFYPPDPSNMAVSTIGGSIALSSGGPMSFKYGTTKDYVLSLTVVLADGQIVKLGAGTIKDASGYQLNRLIIGSEGTLAIVAEAELKLIPKPETSEVIKAYFDSFEDAVNAVNSVISANVFPSAIEFMDNNAIKTVEDFASCGLDTTKEAMLIIETDGFASSMKEQEQRVITAVKSSGASGVEIAVSDEEKNRLWRARRVSYAATARLAPDVLSDDIIVPRSSLAKMVTSCKEICARYNLKLCMVGHVGDGNIHPQIALDLNNEEEYKNYTRAKSEIYQKTLELGGTISAEHGIGLDKINYLEKFSASVDYMKKIKKVFDPKNILNPGKIFYE